MFVAPSGKPAPPRPPERPPAETVWASTLDKESAYGPRDMIGGPRGGSGRTMTRRPDADARGARGRHRAGTSS